MTATQFLWIVAGALVATPFVIYFAVWLLEAIEKHMTQRKRNKAFRLLLEESRQQLEQTAVQKHPVLTVRHLALLCWDRAANLQLWKRNDNGYKDYVCTAPMDQAGAQLQAHLDLLVESFTINGDREVSVLLADNSPVEEPGNLMQKTSNLLEELLLGEKLRIAEIPFALRTDGSAYITACRVARNRSPAHYLDILTLLLQDIEKMSGSKKDQFERLYENLLDGMKHCR